MAKVVVKIKFSSGYIRKTFVRKIQHIKTKPLVRSMYIKVIRCIRLVRVMYIKVISCIRLVRVMTTNFEGVSLEISFLLLFIKYTLFKL